MKHIRLEGLERSGDVQHKIRVFYISYKRCSDDAK